MANCPICGKYADKYFLTYQVCSTCFEGINELRNGNSSAIDYFKGFEVNDKALNEKLEELFDDAETKDEQKKANQQQFEERMAFAKEIENNKSLIKITTTNSFDGYYVKDYIDVVNGEIVVPNGILGALTNGIFFTIDALTDARKKAVDQLKVQAAMLHANAVIGIDIDIQDLNGHGMMVSTNGTAVIIEKMSEG